MSRWFHRISDRLDIHPGERRALVLSALAAFFMLAFVILGKALREGLYLTTFDITTLPYITASVVVLSFPTVALFSRLLGRYDSRQVLRYTVWIEALGLAVLLFMRTINFNQSILVVLLYIWTTLGALLLTSGFWITVSEQFGIRGAKRVFGLIGAGGTAGALTMGLLLKLLTQRLELIWLVPGLILLLLLVRLCIYFLPDTAEKEAANAEDTQRNNDEKVSPAKAFGLIWHTRHLRFIALIVFTTVVASTLIDYQFKEIARQAYPANTDLTGFLGAFYGWMGGIALVIQLICSTRVIANAGIARSLAIMPSLLLIGSIGFILLPSLKMILFVRGASDSLRKSLHRQLVELLYVPIPAILRRQTKTFIDSVIDSAGEGFGALVIFICITLCHCDSYYLSILVVLCSIAFILLSRRMGAAYLNTIVTRLREGEESARDMVSDASLRERNLLTANISQVDLTAFMDDATELLALYRQQEEDSAKSVQGPDHISQEIDNHLVNLKASNDEIALNALITICREGQQRDLTADEITGLIRSLARDTLYHHAVKLISGLGDKIAPDLLKTLSNNSGDFVIRRRIPTILARIDGEAVEDALLDGLLANRFEIRFRAALALTHRRKIGLAQSKRDWQSFVWQAIRAEVFHERPIWELQHLLDKVDVAEDEFVSQRVGLRGELSLEHTFRLIALVGDPEPVRATYYGIILRDQNLNSYALEYLEQILPKDIRKRLWLFIGDVSEYNRKRGLRSLDKVVDDLMATRATLFAGEEERKALLKLLADKEKDKDKDKD